MTTQRKRKTPKAILIAAIAVILTVAFVGTAIATNFFRLRDTVIPDTDITVTFEWPDGTVVEHRQQFVSLQGFAGNPEHDALVEWQEFLAGYDREALSAILGNSWMEEVPQVYQLNGAFSLEMAYRMNEILDRHGLVLRGEYVDTNTNTPEEFMEYFQTNLAYGPLFTDDSIWFTGYVFENGTFQFAAEYNGIGFQFRASRKGVFDDVLLNIGDISAFSEWNYVNRHGMPLILAQSNAISLILTETETFFFAVNILAGTDGKTWQLLPPPFTRSNLESFADLIDFGQIRTDMPALVRYEFPDYITEEAIELERSRMLAKRAELDSEQAGNREAIEPFVGMWTYVGSEADDGSALPMFHKEGLMITEDLSAFFWNGEGVLEKYLNSENPEMTPEGRFFNAFLSPIESNEFEVRVYGVWNYTDEELAFATSDWDSMRLQYDPTSGLMRFTDWNGVHHFFERD